MPIFEAKNSPNLLVMAFGTGNDCWAHSGGQQNERSQNSDFEYFVGLAIEVDIPLFFFKMQCNCKTIALQVDCRTIKKALLIQTKRPELKS